MRQTTGTHKSPGEKIVKDIKRAIRKHYSFNEDQGRFERSAWAATNFQGYPAESELA